MKKCMGRGLFLISASLAILPASLAQETIQVGDVVFDRYSLEIGRGETQFVSADLNRDGHADIVATNGSGDDLTVFLGNESGSLRRHGSFSAGPNPDGVALADFNGDGFADLVVANHETSYVTLLWGDGRGNFAPDENVPLHVNVSPHPHAVIAADMDSDGHSDIIVDHRDGGAVKAFRGFGDGSFDGGTIVTVGGDPYRGMAIDDLNGDGAPDVISPNPDSVGIVLNSGGGGFIFDAPYLLRRASPFSVGVGDFNADGYLDLVAASDGRLSDVRIFSGDGKGAFQTDNVPAFRMASGAKSLATGDVNGDGVTDALIASWNSDVRILIGGIDNYRMIQISDLEVPWGLIVVDLNKDGKDDFIIADGERADAAVYLSRIDGK